MLGILALAVVALIGFAWAPGFAAPYQYDDYVTPVKDPASQSLTSFRRSVPGTLRPLTKLTYATESSLGARSAPGRRVANSVMGMAAAALVALLARAAGVPSVLAVLLAAAWACHPVHAETVIALAGRSVLLALCLTLLSAHLLLRGRDALALAVALLAVLSRETALAWLVACAGLVAWRRGQATRHQFGAIAAAAVLGAVLVASERLRTLLAFSLADPAAWNRLGLQWAALSKGLLMLVFEPGAFAVDIDFSPVGWPRVAYLLATIAAYGAAAWLGFRREQRFAMRALALLWLSLVIPLHSVVPKLDPLTARSFSASSSALVALFAAVLARTVERSRAPRVMAWAAAGAACLVLVLLVPMARARSELYREPVALWRDAAARSRTSVRPLVNLGTLLAQRSELAEARDVLEEAVRRDPKSRGARERLEATNVLIETKNLLTAPGPRANGGRP